MVRLRRIGPGCIHRMIASNASSRCSIYRRTVTVVTVTVAQRATVFRSYDGYVPLSSTSTAVSYVCVSNK